MGVSQGRSVYWHLFDMMFNMLLKNYFTNIQRGMHIGKEILDFISSIYIDLVEVRVKICDTILSMLYFSVGKEMFNMADKEQRIDTFRFGEGDPELLVVRVVYQFLDGYLCRENG